MSDLLSGLANFTKTVTGSLNTYEIRKLGDKFQGMVMNYTEAETKVREATNEDPWGPTGPQMAEIAHMTFQYDAFPEIMAMLWRRMLQENKYAWRRVYKSLTLLNYLLKNGSERVVGNARDHVFEMRALENYKFIDDRGRDQGLNVRHRAKLLIDLIQDEDQLRMERKKAKMEGKEKYQGYSKDDMRLGRGGSGRTSSFDNWNSYNYSGRRNSVDEEAREAYRDREVNSFQFPDEEGRNVRDSPELGIREKTPEPPLEDEDEFGDFAKARNVNTPPKAVSTSSPPPAVPPPPTIPGPASRVIHAEAKAPDGGADLLGLGVDLFGSDTAAAKAVSPATPLSKDLFAVHSQLPAQPSPAPIFALNNYDFSTSKNGSFSPAPVNLEKVPYVGSTASATTPMGPSTMQSPHFAPFDNSVKSSYSSASADAFSSIFSDSAQSGSNKFSGVPLSATPVAPSSLPGTPVAQATKKAAAMPRNDSKQPAKPQIKIPSTWSDASNKVNIDLDNLGMKKTAVKQSISMSQMAKIAHSPPAQAPGVIRNVPTSQSMGSVPLSKPTCGTASDLSDLLS